MADVSLYEAPVILQGHGRPNVFLAGQVGQKYKDLDSGLEWVCAGERGFIKVDGDDQSEMYNWELVESCGSTGGGVFTVNIMVVSEVDYTSDKTYNEVKTAIDSGFICQAICGIYIMPLIAYSDEALCFSCVVSQAETPHFMQIIINNDDTISVVNKSLQTK